MICCDLVICGTDYYRSQSEAQSEALRVTSLQRLVLRLCFCLVGLVEPRRNWLRLAVVCEGQVEVRSLHTIVKRGDAFKFKQWPRAACWQAF